MMKKSILLLAFALLLGCEGEKGSDSIKKIDIPYKSDDIAKFDGEKYDFSYDITLLELNEDVLETIVPEPYSFLASDGYYYICTMDANTIIYDKNGNYVKNILRGNGEGELSPRIKSFLINNEASQLEVFDPPQLKKFTLAGDYLGEERWDIFHGTDVFKHGNYYIWYNGMGPDSTLFTVANTKDQTVRGYANAIDKSNSIVLLQSNRITADGENSYMAATFDNKIYKINKNDSVPRPVFEVSTLRNFESFDIQEQFKGAYNSDSKYFAYNRIAVGDKGKLITIWLCRKFIASDNSMVIYNSSTGSVMKHPFQNFSLLFSDGEYQYFALSPVKHSELPASSSEEEQRVVDELGLKIEENGLDTNPYIIKVKISEKK